MNRRVPLSFAITILPILSAQEIPKGTGLQSPTFGTTVVVPAGLRGTVYFIPRNTMVLPDFTRDDVQAVGEIWTNNLNIPPRHWRLGFPGLTERFEWFAIDYNGRFWIDKPGRYTFALLSDDGSRLFVDDTPVIDNDCQHPPDIRIAAVEMGGGVHRIRVSYFQGPRDCLSLVLAMAGADHEWRVFNTTELKPPSNPEAWHFPTVNTVTIVAPTPEAAALSMKALFEQLIRADPNEKLVMDPKAGSGCTAAPVRACSN